MVTEARLERVASELAPVTPGWFVVNTAEAAWVNNEWSGGVCIFESDDFVLRGRPDLTEYVKPNAGPPRERCDATPIPCLVLGGRGHRRLPPPRMGTG